MYVLFYSSQMIVKPFPQFPC